MYCCWSCCWHCCTHSLTSGALGGFLALVLQQAQQRLAAISEVPDWDAPLHPTKPAGSSKQLAPWYSDINAAGV
jgi:hypothetical protein